MEISNLSAIRNEVRGNTTGTTGESVVSCVFGTVTTTSEANTGAVPSNPTSPTVAATGVAVTNTHPYAVNVSITGGTVTHIKINGTSTGLTSGNFVVPSGGTVSITYSAAPTWVWTNADGRVGFVEALVGESVERIPYYPA